MIESVSSQQLLLTARDFDADAIEKRMLLRHLVTQFLQQQAKAKFAEALREGVAPKSPPDSKTPRHDVPLLLDGLIFYPSELDGGGLIDLLKDKQTSYCESFTERIGSLGPRRVALIETGDGPNARAVASAA